MPTILEAPSDGTARAEGEAMKVAVVFKSASGHANCVDVEEGWTLMEAATSNGIEGILAECGGACSCATCHVHVDRDWLERIPPASEDEKAMLEYALELADNSRLACQIKVTKELEGIEVSVPSSQL